MAFLHFQPLPWIADFHDDFGLITRLATSAPMPGQLIAAAIYFTLR